MILLLAILAMCTYNLYIIVNIVHHGFACPHVFCTTDLSRLYTRRLMIKKKKNLISVFFFSKYTSTTANG